MLLKQCQLGERRHHSRHGGLRGPNDPPLVAGDRPRPSPRDRRLVITADGGGSNGDCVRLWKRELQRLTDEIGVAIEVHHLIPEDQQVEQDRAPSILVHTEKLASQTVGQLSGHRRSDLGHHLSTGLEVRCELDADPYPKGVTIPDAEMAALNVEYAEFHGERNYTICPTNRSDQAIDS
jgi:hypothetical protein